jgi:hypothetical protein
MNSRNGSEMKRGFCWFKNKRANFLHAEHYMTCFDGTRNVHTRTGAQHHHQSHAYLYIHQCTACVYVLLELWFRSPLRWKRVDRFDRRRGWAQVVCVASMTPFYLTVNNAMLSLKIKTFGEISVCISKHTYYYSWCGSVRFGSGSRRILSRYLHD